MFSLKMMHRFNRALDIKLKRFTHQSQQRNFHHVLPSVPPIDFLNVFQTYLCLFIELVHVCVCLYIPVFSVCLCFPMFDNFKFMPLTQGQNLIGVNPLQIFHLSALLNPTQLLVCKYLGLKQIFFFLSCLGRQSSSKVISTVIKFCDCEVLLNLQ